MKNIFKNKLTLALFLSPLLIASCDDTDDTKGYSNLEVAENVIATINLVSPLSVNQTVKEGEQDIFNYTITLNKPQSVDIHISITKIAGDADENDFEYDSEIIIPAYSTAGSGEIKILNDDEDEENETFTLKIGNVNTSNATLESKELSFTIIDCYSDLAGTYSYSTTNVSAPTGEFSAGPLTGSVTFTATGGGVYEISDASFGGWIGLYGVGNIATGVSLVDLCGGIAYDGVDQYGEVFTFTNLIIAGSNMSFHWENDYGEYGDTTLTRTDGSNWPNLTLQP